MRFTTVAAGLHNRSVAAILSLTLIVIFPGSAFAQDALPWFHTYNVPGNYVVGGVDAVPLSVGGGLKTQRIGVSGVPANAEILAAFLYWETTWSGPASTLDTLRGRVKFRGQSVSGVSSSSIALTGSFTGCRGTGTGQTKTMMRADVLRLLPLQVDDHGEPTGRRVVNNSDLIANSLPLHTVTLPDSGVLDVVPQSPGATLLLIYQDPNPLAPLTSIVVYDGLHIQAPGSVTQLTIRGFVDAATNSAAKLTYIVGSGEKNLTERVYFGGTTASLTRVDLSDPFPGSGPIFRGWSNPTFNMPAGSWLPDNDPDYGEQVRTKIDHTLPLRYYDCLSTGAVVFSTALQDGDGDGLADKLESVGGLKNPDGQPYPDITGPADPTVRDLFVEIGALKTAGHNHMPTPEVLRKVGDAFAHPPVGGPVAIPPIAVHFDVGDVGDYHDLGPEFASHEADAYILGVLYPELARGGEQIEEQESSRFPGYGGVVSWPGGYQFLALQPVGVHGEEIGGPACSTLDPDCRRRFDVNRQGIFHYLLYAHARALPKSEFPCLTAADEPVAFPVGMTDCGDLDDNPEYYTPKSTSGVAELPGHYAMVSLGLWDHSLGTPNMQANTTLHELAHNLNLWHGGAPPVFTSTPSGVHVFVAPNCRPNHLSIMSYLFQATGVKNAAGEAQTRLSGEVNVPINEQALFDGSLGLSPDAPYTSWYAPKEPGTSGATFNLTTATKHCDGTPLGPDDPAVGVVRLDAASPDALIDWAGNGGLPEYPGGQDVNFDGKKAGEAATLVGYNDWDGIALNRLGSGHDVLDLSLGLGLDFSGLDFSGLDFSGLDFSGLGLSGLDFSGLDFSGLDFSGLDFSGLDFSGLDFSGLEAEVEAELTYDHVLEAIAPGGSSGPRELKAFVRGTDGAGGTHSSVPAPGTWVPIGEPTNCSTLTPGRCHQIRLDWLPPDFGTPEGYKAFRVWDPTGVATEPTAASLVDPVGTTAGATTVVDDGQLPNGERFIYWTQGLVGGKLGLLSNFAALPARNDPPVAINDTGYVTNEDTAIDIDVVANDTDPDTASNSALRVVAGSITNVHGGTALLLMDGRTVRFTPDLNANSGNTAGGFGFSYRAYDGQWSRDAGIAMSEPSLGLATVSITVNPVNDRPTASAVAVGTLEDTTQTITLAGGDVETCNLTFSIVSGPSHGTLSAISNTGCVPGTLAGPIFNADSAFVTYAPGTNYNGPDSFTYKVLDTGDGASPALYSYTATVSITIAPVNDKPTAANNTVSTPKNTAKAITLTGGDVETCNLTFSIVSGPSHGTLNTISNNGCVAGTLAGPIFNADTAGVTYTPTAGYVGPDSFTFKVHDTGDGVSAALDSDAATVSITVTSPDTSLTFVRADVWLANDKSSQTKFDVKAEVLKNGAPVATATLTQTKLGYGITNPLYKEITGLTGTVPFGSTDILSLRVSVKLSTAVSGTTKVKVWYNHESPPGNTGHIHAKIGSTDVKYYMIKTPGGALGLKKGSAPGPTQYIELPVTTSYTVFGTWSITGP